MVRRRAKGLEMERGALSRCPAHQKRGRALPERAHALPDGCSVSPRRRRAGWGGFKELEPKLEGHEQFFKQGADQFVEQFVEPFDKALPFAGAASRQNSAGRGQYGGPNLLLDIGARDLPQLDRSRLKATDACLVVYLLNDGGRKVELHKTPVIESNSNPRWPPFTVELSDVESSMRFEFVVFDSDNCGEDGQIGAVTATVGQLERRPMLALDGNGGWLCVSSFL